MDFTVDTTMGLVAFTVDTMIPLKQALAKVFSGGLKPDIIVDNGWWHVYQLLPPPNHRGYVNYWGRVPDESGKTQVLHARGHHGYTSRRKSGATWEERLESLGEWRW